MISLLNEFTTNGILHRYLQIHLFFFLPTGIMTVTSVSSCWLSCLSARNCLWEAKRLQVLIRARYKNVLQVTLEFSGPQIRLAFTLLLVKLWNQMGSGLDISGCGPISPGILGGNGMASGFPSLSSQERFFHLACEIRELVKKEQSGPWIGNRWPA